MINESNVEQGRLKHSGLGVASFVIALCAGGFELIVVAIAGILEVTSPTGLNENSMAAVVVGIAMFLGLGLCCFGLGLATGGLVAKDRLRSFAILGFIFNCAIIIGTVGLILLGVAAE